MLLVVKRSLLLSASVALAPLAPPAHAQPPSPSHAQPLPALPGSDPPSAGASGASPAGPDPNGSTPPALSARELYDHIRRGVVAVERHGVPLAIGTVLDGDGRILTALSGLGGSDVADIRYADGTTAHARVGNDDKAFDLALLVPQERPAPKWTEGLAASEADPVGTPLRAMLPARGAHPLGPAEAAVKGRVDAHARSGEPLLPMLDVDVKGPLVAGAPLLDATGSVVAVLVHACRGPAGVAAHPPDPMPWAAWGAAAAQETAPAKASPAASGPSTPCTPVVLGAPVSAIRSFLSKTPATAVAPAPWLGIRGEAVEVAGGKGVRVLAVAPSSPAEKAGLRAVRPGGPDADVIVAADDRPIDTPEKLSEAIGKHAPGEAVRLLVFGEDRYRQVAVTLRAAP